MIAADVLATEAADFVIHDLFCPLEAVARTDLIALRLEAAQELPSELL